MSQGFNNRKTESTFWFKGLAHHNLSETILMKCVSLKLDGSGWRHEWDMKNEESECRLYF